MYEVEGELWMVLAIIAMRVRHVVIAKVIRAGTMCAGT